MRWRFIKSRFWNKLLVRVERSLARPKPTGEEERIAYARNELLLVRERLARFPNEVLLLQQGLQDERAKLYLGGLFAEIGWVPEALYEPMMRAAIKIPMER